MDPITLAMLAFKFAFALKDRDGAETLSVVSEYLSEHAEAKAQPEQELSRDIEVLPYLKSALVDAMNGDALSFTLDVYKFLAQDGMLQTAFGISHEMERYQTSNICPVGHHFTAFPAWIAPDGTKASRLTSWTTLYSISPLMRARCGRGHEWLVFPMQK